MPIDIDHFRVDKGKSLPVYLILLYLFKGGDPEKVRAS